MWTPVLNGKPASTGGWGQTLPLVRCSESHKGLRERGPGFGGGSCQILLRVTRIRRGGSGGGGGGGDGVGTGKGPWGPWPAAHTHRNTFCFPSNAGAGHPPAQVKDRTTPPWGPARTTSRGRSQDSREARPSSPKRRRRHLSPEVPAPLTALTSRLVNQVEALDVALDDLRAPGGAFLRVPARGTEPTASQRAWLSWQLAHAGANLHWALSALDTLLAAQPGLTCQQRCMPGASWP